MNLSVYAEVDTNDGDYVGSLTSVTSEEAERFADLVIRSGDSLGQWSEGEQQRIAITKAYPCFSEEEIEFVTDKLPRTEYGFHTVVDVRIVQNVHTL